MKHSPREDEVATVVIEMYTGKNENEEDESAVGRNERELGQE